MSRTRTPAITIAAAILLGFGASFGFLGHSNALPVGDTALPDGKENTSVIVQNAGPEPATIVMDVYRPDGTIVPGATRQQDDVPIGGTVNFPQALNQNLEIGFRGLGAISSTQPINALIVRDILNSLNLKSYSIASGAANGGRKLAIPIAFNELLAGQWNSRVSVVNAGSVTACVKMTYILLNDDGTQKQTVVDQPGGQAGCAGGGHSIPVSGQLTFGRAGAGVTRFPLTTDNNQMAILIEVLNAGDNPVAANVDIYRSDGNRLLGSYEGLVINEAAPTTDDVGTEVIIPLTIKDPSGFYTVIGVQNVSGAAGNVSIQYVGVDGVGSPVNVNVDLGAVSNAAFHSVYQTGAIPVGFIGYARVTSTQSIAAMFVRGKLISSVIRENEPTYTAARGVPVDQAGTSWSLPLIFRRFTPTTGFGFNSWIQVQVADGSTAQVTLRFVGDPVFGGGCPVGPYEITTPVTGSRVFYMNLNTAIDNGFPGSGAPSCFFGGARVTANKPVIVVSNVTSDIFAGSDNDGLYNGFKQ